MNEVKSSRDPSAFALISAFAAVYIIWGSTYFGIKVAIESLPGFTMAGVRFLTAGSLLYMWCRMRGAERPSFVNWRNTFIVGAFLLFGANGSVVWAEQRVPSGLTALLVAILPVWMVLLEWIRPGGKRPTLGVTIGVLLGIVGVCVLIGPESIIAGQRVDISGALALLMAGFLWAAGSIYSRHSNMPKSPLLATSMQMLAGGVLLAITGYFTGDWARFDPGNVTSRSLLALGYLIVFGSWIGFSAYVWLLRVTTPARVSTYAYVNPVVALVIGCWLADEKVDARILIAAGIIIVAVAVITLGGAAGKTSKTKPVTVAAMEEIDPLVPSPPSSGETEGFETAVGCGAPNGRS